MLDVGWSELLLIGVVALIVIGPKDLPQMFHTMGRIMARARGMAREFSSAMEDAAKSSGLDEAGNTLRDVKSLTSKKALGLDALERAADRFEKWDPKISPRNSVLKPDPAQDAAPAADGETPASAVADMPPAPGIAAPLMAETEHESGQRRLHAVRRSDTKER